MSDYSLARKFFVWLGTFTPGELADSMGIDDELAVKFIRAGCWKIHSGEAILDDTGETVNGTYRGNEPLYTYRPITEESPRNHPHHLPEWIATPGVGSLAPRNRGMPVRIRTDRDTRRLMSTPGARSKVIQAEKRYDKMMASWAAQKERARIKAIHEKDIGNAKKRLAQSHAQQ